MKKYYVDGGILIETPFFKCLGGGAGFGYGAVPGCKIIPTTNKLPSGEEYLLIDDEHPQTMFAEYYARTFFTTGYCWASLFHNSYRGAYSEFCNRIKDAGELIKISCDIGDGSNVSYLLMRQAFLIVLTALDTFIADTVLTRIINDEEIFYSYAVHTRNYKNCVKDIEDGENGKAEQKVIKFVLSQSYLSKSTIKETYLLLFGFSVVVDDEMKDLFRQRHLIAHRGGRQKNGNYLKYTEKDIEKTINRVDTFIKDILKKVQMWEPSREE